MNNEIDYKGDEYPWNKRDELGNELWQRIQSHPQKGNWQKGYAATSLMLNSASYGEGQEALRMVIGDIVRAHSRKAPIDIIKFALNQVVAWRGILLETQPMKDDEVTGEITLDILKKELEDKLPQNFHRKLFSEDN